MKYKKCLAHKLAPTSKTEQPSGGWSYKVIKIYYHLSGDPSSTIQAENNQVSFILLYFT